jgi:hypothetical protein
MKAKKKVFLFLKLYKLLTTRFNWTKIRKRDLTWDRCYDHNFLRFLPIFYEKIGFFHRKQCYDNFFKKTSCSLSKKTPIFLLNVSAKMFKKSQHRSLVGKSSLLQICFIGWIWGGSYEAVSSLIGVVECNL